MDNLSVNLDERFMQVSNLTQQFKDVVAVKTANNVESAEELTQDINDFVCDLSEIGDEIGTAIEIHQVIAQVSSKTGDEQQAQIHSAIAKALETRKSQVFDEAYEQLNVASALGAEAIKAQNKEDDYDFGYFDNANSVFQPGDDTDKKHNPFG